MYKKELESTQAHTIFSGNIYIFHAFDIGEDINLEEIEKAHIFLKRPTILPKYFKKYHIPLAVELPHPHETSSNFSCKLHSFGVVSLIYKIPFEGSLEDLRENISHIEHKYQEYSVSDATTIFKKIRPHITRPKFFHLRTSYPVIQVFPQMDASDMQEKYGNIIASLIRFENENLSEYTKDEILDAAMGYYRGDLIVIDSEGAFVADDEFEELIDLFEFANIQQLELQYYDKFLDQQLNTYYERKVRRQKLSTYLPFVGMRKTTTLDLGRLKVDISVIVERLENNIKLTGEAYYSEIYSTLATKLDLKRWKEALNNKLEILADLQEVYQNLINTTREDLLSVLVIILIFIELVIGILSYLKT